ncbi:hypothetical protein [Holophaga foetida]|uniref:hypothetical protein n=1 Tax=Holophaga foetida TaxID=35839 RepID=UPI0002473705|nr:hypothetical protein [Holophaga foetida]
MIIFVDPSGERFTQAELYAFFARVWTQAQVVFGFQGDSSYNFQAADMRVNVMGIRGLFYAFKDNKTTYQNSSVAVNKSGVFDDCILVMQNKGSNAKLHAFSASLEYGKPSKGEERPDKLRDLRLGMHRYKIDVHPHGRPRVDLGKTSFYPNGKSYRALRPFKAGAYHDGNQDRTQNPKEGLHCNDYRYVFDKASNACT